MANIDLLTLIADDGGPPCAQDRTLWLATCKSMIRSSAERGDLVYQPVKRPVESPERSDCVEPERSLSNELMAFGQELGRSTWPRVAGKRTNTPKRDVCHRGPSGEIVDIPDGARHTKP